MKDKSLNFKVLTIDIGGSHIKGTILDQDGNEVEAYKSLKTPDPASPENVVKTIQKLVEDFKEYYHYISVGFPGYVKAGVVQTAPNLGNDLWEKVKFEKTLSQQLKKPAKVLNDADLQGLGVVSGKGFEIMITLGTGFGTAFLENGELLPHIELAHHPVTKKKDYDAYIGDDALDHIGEKKWNKRMKKVLNILNKVFNYDRLYLGGGNARLIDFDLPDNVQIVTNEDGIAGGTKLWKTKKTTNEPKIY